MEAADRQREPIWILDDGRTLGGGQQFTLGLGEHLGRGVTIVCPNDSSLGREAHKAGLAVAEAAFPAPSIWCLPALAASSWRLRNLIPPDAVVLSGAIRTTFVALLARLTNPTIVLMHERASASRISVKVALRNCRAIVVVGSESADEYRRALPGAAIWTVNNFLSPSRLREFEAVRTNTAPNLSRARPVLGVLARLIPQKGVRVLVEELATYPEAWERLIVAGSRQDERHARAIENSIRVAGLQQRISLVGERRDVPSFLSQLDALVVPSTGLEGQPTVILEGLAAGLPVIVRAHMTSSDFVGFPVVGYHDAAELHKRILHLPDAPADPQLLAERFGVDQLLATLGKAINSAASNTSSPV